MARADRRRPARRRARLLDLAHAQPPRRRRPQHPDLARRGGGADGDRPRPARGRRRLAADRLGLRGPGRARSPCSAGSPKESGRPDHHLAAAVRCPARRLARRCWPRSTRPTREGLRITAPGALAADQRAAGLRAVAEPVHGPADATRRSPTCRSPSGWPSCASPSSARASWRRRSRAAGASAGVDRWDRMFPLGDPPDYEPHAREQHRRPRRAAKGGRRRRWPTTCCSSATAAASSTCRSPTIADGNLDVVREMIAAPNTLIGLGDGGAHVGIMCDATATSYTLTHWTRDRTRGALFPVAWAIKRLTPTTPPRSG